MATQQTISKHDIVHDAENMARIGLPEVEAFFKEPNTDQEKKARLALKMLAHYASIRSTRAREVSTLVSMAKVMELKGEALTPVFEEMTGQSVAAYLPEAAHEAELQQEG